MSGLFGYFDPVGELAPDTVERMARVLGCPTDQSTTILKGSKVAIGCVSKGIYPGEGEVLTGKSPARKCLFTGRLLGFSGEEGTVDAAPECLAAANGPFAAAVWDDDHHRLELITDRYGMYPIYLARHQSAVLFAGQIKALLAPGVLPLEFDPLALTLMLVIGEMVDDLTLIRSVRLMPAGCKAVFSTEGEKTSRYWQCEFEAEETDFDGCARRLGQSLRTAVGRVCSDSASVGVPLSGGLDSRVLLAAAPDPTEVPSFTWGLAGCRDLRYAAATAKLLGSPHQGFEYDGGYLERLGPLGVWITEGQTSCTNFHVLPFMERVAERCSVILNGYAGDALLGGNFIKRAWWRADHRRKAGAELWRWRDVSLKQPYNAGLFGPVLRGCGLDDARTAFIKSYLRAPGKSSMDAAMAFLLDNRVRRCTSCGTSLVRWHVESDHPFFDNDFLDHVSRVPHSWRFRHRLYLCMLRMCFGNVAKVPWQRTGLPAGAGPWLRYPALGVHRLGRYKPFQPLFWSSRVSDFDGWMRGPLRSFVVGLLNDSRTLERGLCDASMLQALVKEHMESLANHSSLLGSVIALELFARLFLDREAELIEGCRVSAPKARIITVEASPQCETKQG